MNCIEKIEICNDFEEYDLGGALSIADRAGFKVADLIMLFDEAFDAAIVPIYCNKQNGVHLAIEPFASQGAADQAGWGVIESDVIQSVFNNDFARAKYCIENEIRGFSEYYGFSVYDNEWLIIDSGAGFHGDDPDQNGMKDHIGYKELIEANELATE